MSVEGSKDRAPLGGEGSRVRAIALWTLVITVGHFSLDTRSVGLHGVHIFLGGLYLVPILMAAVAYELRGGMLAAAAVSVLYVSHLLWSWRDSPLANADQFAMVGVYWIVGASSGRLVQMANVRKWQRDEVLRKATEAERLQGMAGLLAAMGARDAGTLAHCRRVARIATRVGSHLGFDAETLTRLDLAGLVHDIGKVGVPDDVLLNESGLTEEQQQVMRRHVDVAVHMLESIHGAGEIARLVSLHHECPDGSGYPHGVAAESMPPEAHVLRVADVYAALTEPRPYRTPLPAKEALAQMAPWAGTKLDAAALDALTHIIEKGEADIGIGRVDPGDTP